jgi:hypothetical protein
MKTLLGIALMCLSAVASAHSMKGMDGAGVSIEEHSYMSHHSVTMTLVNGGKPMSYEVEVDGVVRGSIGRELLPNEEFPFHILLEVPVASTTPFTICTISEPVDGHRTKLCATATLSRY